MTSAVTAPLERPVWADVWPETDVVAKFRRCVSYHLTVPANIYPGCREQEVQAAINAATNLLPSDLPNPPVYSKVNPADPPIMTLAVHLNRHCQ
ncbi:hypothetical protein LAD67_14910 [Escherichia coli]|nr:hypothetical protein [Escherichia coli]